MFENLRSAFREAVKNFKEELNRDEVPEAVDRLLVGMRDEVTEAKTRLHDLDEGIERARAEAAREAEEAATCRRRETMARKIGDQETAGVAADFAEKHETRHEVLVQKAAALEREREVREAEIEEMIEQIREAKKQRDAMAATAGRTGARESIREGDDLLGEIDRMAEKLGFDGDDLDTGLDDFGGPSRPARGDEQPYDDVDVRLADLKRRMGQDP